MLLILSSKFCFAPVYRTFLPYGWEIKYQDNEHGVEYSNEFFFLRLISNSDNYDIWPFQTTISLKDKKGVLKDVSVKEFVEGYIKNKEKWSFTRTEFGVGVLGITALSSLLSIYLYNNYFNSNIEK